MTTRTRRGAVLSVAALSMILRVGPSAWGAPLEPTEGYASAHIGGRARMQPGSQYVPAQDASYSASGGNSRFTSGSFRFSDGVQIGNTPVFRPQAATESLAGVDLQKIADNQYVLTLSSATVASYAPDASLPLSSLALDTHSHATSKISFKILDSSQLKVPATILYRLEHFGTLNSVNSLRAMNQATLDLTATGDSMGLHYSKRLESPPLPPGFDSTDFTGKCNYIAEGRLSSHTGGIINLSARLDSFLGPMMPSPVNLSIPYAAGSQFDSGLRLYMTVMPEPASALLMVAGLWVAARKRR